MKRAWETVGLGLVLAGCAVTWAAAADRPTVVNSTFEERNGNQPAGYTLVGNAMYQYLGDPRQDSSSWGVALHAASNASGGVSQTVHIPNGTARAYRFDFRGLAQDGFTLAKDGQLAMRVDFLGDAGKTYDGKTFDLYSTIEQARHDLTVNGDHHTGGAAVWRTYSLEFIVPFAEVTQVKLSVFFKNAAARASRGSDFYVDDFDLAPIEVPLQATTDVPTTATHGQVVSLEHLIPIGGRWSYAARADENAVPAVFTNENADRLMYFDGQYSAPFAGNMSSWLRAGDKDASGKVAAKDVFVPDNVTVRFDQTSMIVHTKGLPNHPTGRFPQLGGGNPSYITQMNSTYYLPLNPLEKQGHTITTTDNSNHALNMGPIGVAANGVVFFNPFDATSEDATSFMDACCGHPNPFGQYHYHKYPICVNTPWQDAGDAHSPVLGWAFDGFPIYGPYESKGEMAKDLTGDSKLNGFNMHYDAERGWHYHVTPGVFPYIIGGYWGTADRRDITRPPRMNGQRGPGMGGPGGGPPGMGGGAGGPPPGGPGMGGPPDGPPPFGDRP